MKFDLTERLRAIDQVQQIAIDVSEEHKAVAFIRVRLAFEIDALLSQLIVGGIEIINRDGDVPSCRAYVLQSRALAFRWNNLDQTAVSCFDKVVARIFISDFKFQIVNVPIRKSLRVG